MRDYLAYAKEHVHPVLCEEAQQRLIQAYVDMRKVCTFFVKSTKFIF
jgi:DNA replication licensing factor MCM4